MLAKNSIQTGIKNGGHIHEIAKAIINLKASKNFRDTLGHNGRRYAETHFAKEKILDIYENLMLSL